MANAPTIIKGQLTFLGAIAGQVSIQAQPIAGNNLLFNLPNTIPNPNAVISVLSIAGSTVTLGFTPPPPQSFSFSQISGFITAEQIDPDDVEGNGALIQLTTGVAPANPVTAHLGTAASYAILAYSGITNTGSNVITGGNIGSAPTPGPEAGFTFTAPAMIDNANAGAARTAGNAAFAYFSALVPTQTGLANLSANDGGGGVGVYHAGVFKGGALDIPTSITLDAQGDPNAVFVFVSASTTVLESGASVLLVNGAQAANVVWCVGSSFSQSGAGPVQFAGTLLIYTSASFAGQTNVLGRILAVGGGNGAVTFAAGGSVTVTAGSGAIVAGDVVVYDAHGNVVDSGVQLSSLGGGAGVSTFNGRVGNVIPLSGDYSFSLISGTFTPAQAGAGTYAISISGNAATATTAGTISGTITYSQISNPPQLAQTFTPVGGEFLTGYTAGTGLFTAATPAYPVLSVFGRTGVVVAQFSDYSAFYDASGAAATAQSNAEAFATAADVAETARAEAAEAAITASVPVLYDGAGNPAAEASASPASFGDNHISSGTVVLALGGSPATSEAVVTLTGASEFAANYYVYLTYVGVPTNPGHLYYIPSSGSSFTIYSDSATDTSNVAWTAIGY